MEYKYPIAKEDGKDYTAEELYGKLSNERAGHYLLSANGFWHGGIHFSTPNISEKTLVQAIAEGTVVAYRINKEYETIPAITPPEGYKYSTGFCLIKHSIPVEKSDQLKEEEAQAVTDQNVQDNKQAFEGKKVTVQIGPRAYRVAEGITKDNAGTYAKGTELEVISVGDKLINDYYFAKVKKVQTDPKVTEKEYYVAFLDKEGNPVKDSKGNQVFEIPAPKETAETKTPETTDATATKATETDKKTETPTETKPEEKPAATPVEKPNPNIFNLEFYSLYMHLSAYEDYEPKKEEKKDEKETKKENERVTIKATGLSIRDKHRDDKDSKVIGKVSNGAVLEVLETKESANKTFTDIKAKLISGNFTDKDGKKLETITEAWVPTRQDKKSFIEDKKEEAKKAEQARKRPSYWEGTVTAVVKNANGIKIWQTLEGNELKTELGTISLNNQFTFDSTKTKTITVDKKTLLIAECTAIGTFTFRKTGTQPKGKFWTTVDKDSITRTKVEPTVFNTVVPCNTKIIAGEPLGYLGTYETPSQTDDKNSKKQVHVEIFTPDITTVQFLLNNPFKLTGKKYIKVAKGTKLLGAIPSNQTPSILQENKEYEHSSIDYTTKNDHYLVIDDLKIEKQLLTNVEYYKIAVELHTGYLKKEGQDEIDQYDWSKLGFKTVEEPNKDADGYLDPKAMSAIFQQIYSQIDTNKDGKLQPDELKAALKDDGIRDQWSKLIALHPSEWKTDTRAIVARFTKLLTNVFAPKAQQEKAQELLLQETLRMNSLAFLEQVVPPVPPMLYHFHPVTFVEYLQSTKEAQIIFPLKVKPKNDKNGVWKNYYWAAALTDKDASQAIFGRARSGGARKHAARDLYTEALAEVVAICDGEIKSVSTYYYGTWQITVKHETKDGRKFFIRYGEVDAKSITVKVGDKVKQGKIIGKTGLMINPATNKHPSIISGQTVYMLHFEYYTGSEGLEQAPPNNSGKAQMPYDRRKDLADPLSILQEGYRNTFENKTASDNGRMEVSQLNVSSKGKEFIKEWEAFHAKAYNDSEGYCTIGYGHLIEKKKCEDITLPAEFKDGVTKQKANELFESRIPSYVKGLKNSVTVKLHQYEFDALVSLLFNIGAKGLDLKAPSLKRKLNSGDYAGAATEFLDITNKGTSGLVKRRKSENNLFLNNVYDASH